MCHTVFGRVSPVQKKQLIESLKEQGHTVAMTGDGINDVLALKEADCSVAMASGSDAARNISQLVLLNSNFDSMPRVVGEGRRSINNIQRSASLFLVKTIYSTLLAVIFLFLKSPYPFMPIQLTLISAVTIGIPALVRAFKDKAPFWIERMPEIPELVYQSLQQSKQLQTSVDTIVRDMHVRHVRQGQSRYLFGIGAVLLLSGTLLFIHRPEWGMMPGWLMAGGVVTWLIGWRKTH